MKEKERITDLIIFIFLFLSLLFFYIKIYENRTHSKENRAQAKYEDFEALKEDLQNKAFPMDIHDDILHSFENWNVQMMNGALIGIVSERTCNTCLHEQLEVLKSCENDLKEKYLMPLIILGASNKEFGARYLAQMRQTGLLICPVSVEDDIMIQSIFFSRYGIESPLFFYTDCSLTILDIFSPTLAGKEEFKKWLKKISEGL